MRLLFNYLKGGIFCVMLSLPLYAEAKAADETVEQKINAHLAISDVLSACEEAQLGLSDYPHSKLIQEAYIRTLARTNDDKLLWKTWKNYASQFPEPYKNRDLLETMAWGVITTGSTSSSPVTRSMALLGAFFGQDAKGVEIMSKMMHDPNSFIRAVAVKLASHMHDARLSDEVIRLFHEERNWIVRLEVLKAMGSMKVHESRPLLMNLIASSTSTAEEKLASVKSLVELLDTIETEELKQLASSDRSGLRLLACKLIEYFDLNQEMDVLADFLMDNHAEVRIAALHALGIMRVSLKEHPTLNSLCIKLVKDPNPQVAIMGAWVMTLNLSPLGAEAFAKLLKNENPEVRHTSAAALASTGKYGLAILLAQFKEASDPFVRMNLALGLIMQRTATDPACKILYEGLIIKERWMWEESGYFKVLLKSKVKHDDSLPNLPESINQITRLEILNILFIMKYPQAQGALKVFLQQKTNGITGLASALLLTEGDEEAIKIVESLLSDPDKKIKIQAALVLAIWGKGEEAITILEQAYEDADRNTKERILEGLGRIGAPSTIPFLVEKLQEPYQTLRIIAAAALLDCLNH
jgi:HEAT repeat protein